jgi:hypothetical protein
VDVTARRVKARNLAKAVRLRDQRERRAFADLKTAIVHRDAAEDACANGKRELMTQQALRSAGEAQAYGELAHSGPMPLTTLSRHLAAIESLTDDVESASQQLEQAELHKMQADETASRARSLYATQAHQARKWAQLSSIVTTSRRARGERLVEVEVDEESSLRWRRAQVLRGTVR